ncbi:MAG: nucleotidyltransferase family protein [Ignavibacteriae bacterium]|nr:nucleotidyltransferase family protein [Ignavibacteriota bacterium]
MNDCWIGAGFIRNKIWDYLHILQPKQIVAMWMSFSTIIKILHWNMSCI